MSKVPELLSAGFVSDEATALLAQHYVIHDWHRAADPAALLETVGERITCMIGTSAARIPAELINSLPRLQQVCIFGSGYDKVDVDALRQRSIVLSNTPDVVSEDVADLGMTLVLAAVRKVVAADRFVRAGHAATAVLPFVHSVRGMTLGIVGLGRIGLAVARRAEVFGMRIAYHNRSPRKELAYPFYASLSGLAEAADVLLLAAPGGKDTTHMVNGDILAALGPQGTLVNIGRGSLVDESALIAALQLGTLGAAALDVFRDLKKLPQEFLGMENVILSPHRGAATLEARAAMRDLFVANIHAFFRGEKPLTPVALNP